LRSFTLDLMQVPDLISYEALSRLGKLIPLDDFAGKRILEVYDDCLIRDRENFKGKVDLAVASLTEEVIFKNHVVSHHLEV